jgi:hypothetical protein
MAHAHSTKKNVGSLPLHKKLLRPAWMMVACSAILTGHAAHAKPLTEAQVPQALQSWIPWVMHDVKKQTCPFYYTTQEQRICEWPTSIALELNDTTGAFTYVMDIVDTADDKPQRVVLPGQQDLWPQDITVNGRPQPVLTSNGAPTILLSKGTYTIHGVYQWDKLPVAFTLPQHVGIVNVKVNGTDIATPQIEGNQLSVQHTATTNTAASENHLEVKLFRKLTDSIPQMLETSVQLNVSGKQREEVIGTVLSEAMEPLSVTSELPASLDKGGKLRVQVRPGKYDVTIVARLHGLHNAITPPAHNGILPTEEIWSFEAQNNLRLVQVSGALAIDPTQTELPSAWRNLPSFLLKQGDALKIQEIKRGMADSAPDQLTLQRKLWLDFSGEGYTAQDVITGTIKSSSRLEVLDGMKLGSANINGQDQYINTIQKDGKAGAAGVEVREGAISLVSNSRMDSTMASHPSGWNAKFDALSATLYLPPGWKLLGYAGVDGVSNSWISNWTLVDVFMVMITAVAAFRLWSKRLGLVTAITLVLVHPELPAFTSLLLILIICLAIHTALKEGRLKHYMQRTGTIILALLVVTALPFMFEHMRYALYPQLASQANNAFRNVAFGGIAQNNFAKADFQAMDAANAPAAPAMMAAPQAPQEMESVAAGIASDSLKPVQMARKMVAEKIMNDDKRKEGNASLGFLSSTSQQQYQSYAPDTKVQTGYSQRNIRESGIALWWTGSVDPTITMKLWLLSARMNLFLAFARVALIAVVIAALVGSIKPHIGTKLRTLLPMILIAFLITVSPHAYAQEAAIAPSEAIAPQAHGDTSNYPPSELLDTLQEKLSESINQPAECLPECASLARTRISVAAGQLIMDLELHADDTIAVPLPGGISNFRPVAVMVNGTPASSLTVNENGFLMVKLTKGISHIRLAGVIASATNSLGISFPLVSHHTSVDAPAWSVQGVHDNGVTESSVQLTRTQTPQASQTVTAEDSFKKTVLPAFYRIERTISLGNRWEVTTVIYKLNAFEAPSATQIPLLKGESVISSDTEVKNGHVLVSFDAGKNVANFQSVLSAQSPITLNAPKNVPWVEVWRLNTSNLWHATTSGIPRIYEANMNTANTANVMPTGAFGYALWMPWQGESLKIEVERPNGIEGATRTIDQSTLNITPSDRSTDVTLNITIRSSLGGQHTITLPHNAVMTDVTKNGALLPTQLKKDALNLPLTPGSNQFVLRWKESSTIDTLYQPHPVSIGADRSVNANVSVNLPSDRWILFTSGPVMGPAVLFWSWIPIILLLSFGLDKITSSPLRMRHWCLFLLGISLSSLAGIIVMIGWVLLFAWRANVQPTNLAPWRFNPLQMLLVCVTFIAMGSLIDSIHDGLLGYPQMHIQGNGSYGTVLQWYEDITAQLLPQPLVLSAPLWVYRGLMLLWALWLAFSLVRWLRWAWASFTCGGYWNKPAKNKKPTTSEESASETQAASASH